ncbi:hypothetical protein FC47_GL001361 [Limosilactobacillus mucosae DSM 13345]|jgi:hypothetical protein|uniref:Uncharacterized protein n=1 Tax=Limosilactobacillus mucosae DSM 13345 TaxID=1423771 RepID=A0A0R1P2A9_LIMMU|nr:hypothetical protein [Limosilactobacillus mucosae]KRL26695.1 hypothetical protein FC47_GL001361 [Limosilactobacillus mucosae DSM 13345]
MKKAIFSYLKMVFFASHDFMAPDIPVLFACRQDPNQFSRVSDIPILLIIALRF